MTIVERAETYDILNEERGEVFTLLTNVDDLRFGNGQEAQQAAQEIDEVLAHYRAA